MQLKKNALILFQGDSVTDCGRDYGDFNSLSENGYPRLIADALTARYPEKGYVFVNRGVSGNRVDDICARAQKDIFDLKPDLVSILVGINDTWRRFDDNNPRSADEFEAFYRKLLTDIKRKLDIPIVMMAPFFLRVPDKLQWEDDYLGKLDKVRKLADEFADIYIPLDEIIAAEAKRHDDPVYLAGDGVHPSAQGHMLIAKCFLNAVFGID